MSDPLDNATPVGGPCPDACPILPHAEEANCPKCGRCLYRWGKQLKPPDPFYPFFECGNCGNIVFWD